MNAQKKSSRKLSLSRNKRRIPQMSGMYYVWDEKAQDNKPRMNRAGRRQNFANWRRAKRIGK